LWQFGTGTPITLPSEKYYAPELPFIEDLGSVGHSKNATSINGYRMLAFHRLDVGLNYKRQKNKTERIWGLGVINAYGRQNPILIYYSSESGDSRQNPEQLSMFSFPIPYLKYTFKF